jgi:membrane protein required for colicin V production
VNWVDYAIIGIIAISALISVTRGFVREVLSLMAWIAAFWVALSFSQEAAVYLEPHIEADTARHVVAFVGLFLVTLIVVALINYLVVQLIEKTGVSGTDMVLGMVFGIARGIVIVGLMVLLAGVTALPQEPWWQESLLIDHFVSLALWIRDFLPPDLAQNFQLQ